MTESSFFDTDASTARSAPMQNDEIAEVLEQIADLLQAQDASPFRVRSYRHAATNLRQTTQPVAAHFASQGLRGLERLPGIGKSLARVIGELLQTGDSSLLRRLEGEVAGEELFSTLPGLGEVFARRIHDELGIETLEELESAAHDGRLERLPGLGRRRCRMLRDELETRLRHMSRRRSPHPSQPAHPKPTIATLLDMDQAYRERAARGELKQIRPRRFNPEGGAWLPILHEERDGWNYTVLYSNTARAHRLDKARDWVVLFYDRDGERLQSTVVTETRGNLAGKRVVRGRERECEAYYLGASSKRASE